MGFSLIWLADVLEDVEAVEAGAPITHLDEPWPDLARRAVDGDGPCRQERGMLTERVSRHGPGDLGRRCAPLHLRPERR